MCPYVLSPISAGTPPRVLGGVRVYVPGTARVNCTCSLECLLSHPPFCVAANNQQKRSRFLGSCCDEGIASFANAAGAGIAPHTLSSPRSQRARRDRRTGLLWQPSRDAGSNNRIGKERPKHLDEPRGNGAAMQCRWWLQRQFTTTTAVCQLSRTLVSCVRLKPASCR
jgi:hypothetical protein